MQRTIALGVMLVGTVLSAAVADAAAPVMIVERVDVTFPSHFWTTSCGFSVLRHQVGTARVLVQQTSGSAFEMDTVSDWTETLIAPSTGKSFVQRHGPVRYQYPQGIFVGAPARLIELGLELSVPGLPAEAGRMVFEGEIVFIDGGIPFIDVTDFVSSVGHFNDPAAYVAAGCAALGD
jgi:hypothetical protein